jgi:type VI secretion system protein ImpA
MANRVSVLLYNAPLTRARHSFYQYRESRSVGYEEDASQSDAKREAREAAVAEGKVTAEAFDAALTATPKSFYVETESALSEAADVLQRMALFCEERYGVDGPSLRRLDDAIQEVKRGVSALLEEKRKTEPDIRVEETDDLPPQTAELTSQSEAGAEQQAWEVASAPQTRNAPPIADAGMPMRQTAEPADADDAAARIQACARFLSQQDETSPVAYLLQTGLRWGELRAREGTMDESYPPPPTDARQQLRRALTEGDWSELLQASVAAAGEPWGGMWLDLQRYVWKASVELGYGAITSSVLSSLGALLRDFPAMAELSFNDDTPVANAETVRWLRETVLPKPAETAPPVELVYGEEAGREFAQEVALRDGHTAVQDTAVPDTLEIARGLIQQGRAQQAIQLLVRDAAQQESGRLRFQRRTQVAQLCLAAGYESVAAPMLEQLAGEIEQRKLEGWESSELLAPPLTLLLRCMQGKSAEEERRQEIFDRLCRIDPTAAMECSS